MQYPPPPPFDFGYFAAVCEFYCWKKGVYMKLQLHPDRSGEWLRRNGLYCLSSPMVEGLWQRRAKKQPSSKWMCVFSLQQPLNHLTRAQLRNTTVGDKRMPPTQSPIQIRQNVSEWTINHLLSFHFMHLIKPMISVCLPVCRLHTPTERNVTFPHLANRWRCGSIIQL